MTTFALTFDYLCPFARNANETVVRALEDGAGHEVAYRAFSLAQVHRTDEEPKVWEDAERASGVLALEWGLAVRDELPEHFPAIHLALFAARHDQGLDLREESVLADAVKSTGADPGLVAEIVAGGRPAKTLAEDHTWAVEEHRVFGVPTFIAGDRAVFIRLMDRSPDGATARRTVDRVLDLVTGWPELNEFKQAKLPR